MPNEREGENIFLIREILSLFVLFWIILTGIYIGQIITEYGEFTRILYIISTALFGLFIILLDNGRFDNA